MGHIVGVMVGHPRSPETKVRTIKDLDVTAEADKQKVIEVLECALHDLSVRVTVDGLEDLDEDTAAAQFVEDLRSTRPNLHFLSKAGA